MQTIAFSPAELGMLHELLEKAAANGANARTLANLYEKIDRAHAKNVPADKAAGDKNGKTK